MSKERFIKKKKKTIAPGKILKKGATVTYADVAKYFGLESSAVLSRQSDANLTCKFLGDTKGSWKSASFGDTYGEFSFNNRPLAESMGTGDMVSLFLSSTPDLIKLDSNSIVYAVGTGEKELRDITSQEFESIVSWIFKSHGSRVVAATRGTGPDLIASIPVVGPSGYLPIAVEVKHTSVVDIQSFLEFRTISKRFVVSVLVTSGELSASARNLLCQHSSQDNFFIIGGSALVQLLKKACGLISSPNLAKAMGATDAIHPKLRKFLVDHMW